MENVGESAQGMKERRKEATHCSFCDCDWDAAPANGKCPTCGDDLSRKLTVEEKFKQHLLGFILLAGTTNLRVSQRQMMKLKEWVVPYTLEEFDLNSLQMSPIDIEQVRKFIDGWEHPDLSPEDYKYYYVEKNTDGKSITQDTLRFLGL